MNQSDSISADELEDAEQERVDMAAELAIQEKVEAASAWTPAEWSRFRRQSRAMLHEVIQEAAVHVGRLNDLHDRVYPGADCDCDPRCARCRRADEIAGGDPILQDIAWLLGRWDEVAQLESYDLEPDDDREMERRLRRVPVQSSGWVERQRRRRLEHAALLAAPPAPPEQPAHLTVEERLEQLAGCRQNVANLRRLHDDSERHMLRQVDEAEAEVRAEAGLPPRPDPDVAQTVDQLSALRAEDEDAYQRMAPLILKVRDDLRAEREAKRSEPEGGR